MEKYLGWLLLIALAACSGTVATPTTAPDQSGSAAPQPLSPADNHTFVDADITLAWDDMSLAAHQRYVLRLWVDEQPPQEVWTETNEIDAQPLIDAASRDVGQYQWQVAVVNTDANGAFDSMGSEWSNVQMLQRVRRLSPTAIPQAEWSDLTQHVAAQDFETTHETVNYLRDFVHRHATISTDTGYLPDYSDAMQQIYDHSQGEAEAPSLYCNGLSTGMLTTLAQLGIESRLIFLYAEEPGWIAEHTFLEIFNPDTQRWEVHDPTFAMYFVDADTGERVDTQRMVFGSRETIRGCDAEGNCSAEDYQEHVYPYLEAFRYGFSQEIWVNPDRFDVGRRVEAFDNQNFPEFLSDNPRALTFRFDSWDAPAETD